MRGFIAPASSRRFEIKGQPTGGAQTGQSADGIVSGSLPAFWSVLCAVSDLAGDGRCFCSAGDPVPPVL